MKSIVTIYALYTFLLGTSVVTSVKSPPASPQPTLQVSSPTPSHSMDLDFDRLVFLHLMDNFQSILMCISKLERTTKLCKLYVATVL